MWVEGWNTGRSIGEFQQLMPLGSLQRILNGWQESTGAVSPAIPAEHANRKCGRVGEIFASISNIYCLSDNK